MMATVKKEPLTPSTDEIKQQVNGLKEGVIKQANKIVHEIMPKKILDLNELFTVSCSCSNIFLNYE
jgi:hypothetical protein